MSNDDILTLSKQQLMQEIVKLRGAIRYHMAQKGMDRCHVDDKRLYEFLPDREEFLAGCACYFERTIKQV